jgi:hypothetical protein
MSQPCQHHAAFANGTKGQSPNIQGCANGLASPKKIDILIKKNTA